MYRRRLGRRREIKAVSVDAVNARAAFYHHFKSSPTDNNDFHVPSNPLPVQINPDIPSSGPCKLVPRSVGGQTPGLAHCPVCYDILVVATGSSQQRGPVTTEYDVMRQRPVVSAQSNAGSYLVANSRNFLNSSNSIYSV